MASNAPAVASSALATAASGTGSARGVLAGWDVAAADTGRALRGTICAPPGAGRATLESPSSAIPQLNTMSPAAPSPGSMVDAPGSLPLDAPAADGRAAAARDTPSVPRATTVRAMCGAPGKRNMLHIMIALCESHNQPGKAGWRPPIRARTTMSSRLPRGTEDSMDIGLMVEGQNGLTWERWIHILHLAERLRFPTVFRSDHYFIGPQQDSLEAYLSFAVAARETSSIRFGPLVSPVTFRSPVDVGRMAAQLDQLSAGRFVMGMGAGWNEAEHRAYGIPFPPVKERFDRLDEAVQVVKALWAPGPASFAGRYYQLDGADCQPRPTGGRPPILIGGSGEKRTLKLVARYANEWNAVNLSP